MIGVSINSGGGIILNYFIIGSLI